MNEEELKARTRQFALRVMRLADSLPNTASGRTISYQLVRCGTSVGANYRAACNARSKPEFIAKLGIVLEEADESAFWLELLMEGKILKQFQIEPLYKEANELTAIFIASINSAKKRNKNHLEYK